MEYHECLSAIKRRYWLVLVSLATALLAAWAASSFLMKNSYESSATVIVSKQDATFSGGVSTQQDILLSSNTIRVYYNLAESDAVAEDILQRLQLGGTAEKLREQIGVQADYDTGILKITVKADSAVLSRDIAQTFIESLQGQAEKLLLAAEIKTIDAPKIPVRPSSPNMMLNMLLGGAGGTLAGLLLALMYGVRDQSTGSFPVLQKAPCNISLLGTMPRINRSDAQRAPILFYPDSGKAGEAVKITRANLLHLAERDAIKTMLVTSAQPSEGKTTFAVNICVSIAQLHKRVLLIECNCRNPALLNIYNMKKCIRTVHTTAGNPEAGFLVYAFPSLGIDIVLDLISPNDRAGELCSPNMKTFLDEMAQLYDFIFLDCAPILPYADTMMLSELAQGVVIVADYGRLAYAELEKCIRHLSQIEAKILGIVMNRMPPAKTNLGY